MGTFKDLTGMTFGRLTVEGIDHKVPRKPHGSIIYWRCKCSCGKECIVRGCDLTRKDRRAIRSCGCLNREISRQANTTHGMSNTRLFGIWNDIKKRCFNANSKFWKNYGGRGITMFEAWLNDFQAFYDYVSGLENFGRAGYTLDRINNDGNYEPGNVRWADRKTQNRNKRNNAKVIFEGVEMCLKEAAEKSGISYGCLSHRYQRGKRGDDLFKKLEA